MPIIRRDILQYLAWVIALVATVGSLFFSEVMQLPPCLLCWYQRIAMYPLVIIIGSGIVMRDSRMRNYALPGCLIGLAVSIYHNLLYYRIIPESLGALRSGHFVYFEADRMARLHHDSVDGACGIHWPGFVFAVL